jgi:hypothetical protein
MAQEGILGKKQLELAVEQRCQGLLWDWGIGSSRATGIAAHAQFAQEFNCIRFLIFVVSCPL